MSERMKQLLEYNQKFVENKEYESLVTSKKPDKKMVVLSCMDTRLTELLPKAINVKNGDIKLIKNAGAVVMHPFGSIARSILVAVLEFEVEDVVVIGHHGCGMSNLDGLKVLDKAIKAGIDPQVVETLNYSGINVAEWLQGFESPEVGVLESVHMIKHHPLMPKHVKVHGLLMDPTTGALDVVYQE